VWADSTAVQSAGHWVALSVVSMAELKGPSRVDSLAARMAVQRAVMKARSAAGLSAHLLAAWRVASTVERMDQLSAD
jgi:hypothetical protein